MKLECHFIYTVIYCVKENTRDCFFTFVIARSLLDQLYLTYLQLNVVYIGFVEIFIAPREINFNRMIGRCKSSMKEFVNLEY